MTSPSKSARSTRSVLPAAQVRREFIEFFVERGHRHVPSGPVCPPDDPTLLFTNAGMNQFKDVFLGTGQRDYKRAADTQKCIRVSGKHNDLEEVGHDTYHHTFFEMLGNWSFGDYFKEEAIPWAWELLTEVWKLPKERLWVTVFSGDEADGLPADEETERIWREQTDIDPAHVLHCGRADNFWEMGETGPCGPCTEIHIDRGGPDSDPRDGADPAIGVNAGNERFIELWNNVFMQFNRMDDGSLQPLPSRHVDTGMGLERVVAVLQGVNSNYDTDLFTPIFDRLSALVGRPYGRSDAPEDVAFRVIADHMRAVSAAFAEGVLPSNTGRGYVLRRLIRRAARYGRQALGREEPFLSEVVPAVAAVLGEVFPEIPARLEHVQLLVREEELSFHRTLGRGLVRFEELAERVGREGGGVLPGEEVFDLYATYGFPQDLVELMARERGLEVDSAGWRAAEEAHQAASRSEGQFKQLLSAEELEGLPATERTYGEAGPNSTELETTVLRHFPAEGGAPERLVLAASPFYPEGGGQIGDQGQVATPDGLLRFLVEDTKALGDVVVHIGRSEGAPPAAGLEGSAVEARVDTERRERTRRNHTATHLLHQALREVLGDHVTQQGSYVGPDRLRFDLSHPRAIPAEDLDRIEALVNGRVFANPPVETTVEDLAAAKARGVMALFGEKYADRVRVVDVGGWSTELCGGTHVAAAGDIGPFLIVSESAIQAGVRRIEAVTGEEAVARIQTQRRQLGQAAQSLKARPEELVDRIEALQTQVKEAKKQGAASSKADLGAAFTRLKEEWSERDGIRYGVLDFPELDGKGLGELCDRARSLGPDLALALVGRASGKVPFVAVCGGRALAKGLKAGDLARVLAGELGGGGGGKPEKAQGQGLNPKGVEAAVEAARAHLEAALG